MSTQGIFLNKWNDSGRRTVSLSFTYRLNQGKSKYKGEASTGELKGM